MVLESSIRSAWYRLISSQKILRVFDSVHETHFTLAKDSSVFQLANTVPFGTFPRFLTFCFNSEAQHTGNYGPRFVYTAQDLISVHLTANGSSWFDSERVRKLNLEHVDNPDVDYFYQKFLECFPEKAKFVSRKRYFYDMFIFCFDLVPLKSEDQLSLLTSATINLHLQFKTALVNNLIVYIHSHRKSLITIGEQGDILEN